MGVHRLNDSKAEERFTPQDRIKKKETTGNQEIIRGVKSMLVFTGDIVKKKQKTTTHARAHTRAQTPHRLNTDASESLFGGEEARAFGKKNNSTAVTIIFT